jgi:hypothetical protein
MAGREAVHGWIKTALSAGRQAQQQQQCW